MNLLEALAIKKQCFQRVADMEIIYLNDNEGWRLRDIKTRILYVIPFNSIALALDILGETDDDVLVPWNGWAPE